MAAVASNKSVQSGAGRALAFAARNKTVQERTGKALAGVARDDEMQRKVGGEVMRGAAQGARAAYADYTPPPGTTY